MTELEVDDSAAHLLQRHDFDRPIFDKLSHRLCSGLAGSESNRIEGVVEALRTEDLVLLPPPGSEAREELAALGREAIAAGHVGAIVLAGGMATRFGGVVKAGVEALDGLTFLELKVRDIAHAAESAGGVIPLFPMTSFATHDEVVALAERVATKRTPVQPFAQSVSLRLTDEGAIYRDSEGKASPYAPGHGDLPGALRRSGVLEQFSASGGKLLVMSNVDNLTATLDPAILGAHIRGGRPMSAEMAPKLPGDKGGAPAYVDNRLQIVEAFRFPTDFDQDSIPVFNTNTLVFDTEALAREFELDWFAVHKTVDARPVVQFERLVGQLSAFLDCTFIRVDREGSDARFQPVKDPDELKRREPEIRAALRARGIL